MRPVLYIVPDLKLHVQYIIAAEKIHQKRVITRLQGGQKKRIRHFSPFEVTDASGK
jgi:hypothetical protein